MARICVLVQAHAATTAMIQCRRTGSNEPPVPHTRRVSASGEVVLVNLADSPFGRGPHRCPGEVVARRLIDAALAAS